jgi:hypothetical protein
MCAVMHGQLLLRAPGGWNVQTTRTLTSSVRITLDDHTLDVGIMCKCILPSGVPRGVGG